MAKIERKNGSILVDDDDLVWIERDYTVWIEKRGRRAPRAMCYLKGHYDTHQILSRVILGPPKDMEVDHINHDTLDNRRSNLRAVSQKLNTTNRQPYGKTSFYKGISIYDRVRKPFRGQFYFNGRAYYGKVRATEEEAALDYNRLCILAWGHQSILNDVRCMSDKPQPRQNNCPTCNSVCYCCCVCSDEMSDRMQELADLVSSRA